MSEIKLLPCPFCQAELKRWDYMPNVFFEHPYNGCILSGKKVLESEHDVKAWNTRKPMERIIERICNVRNNTPSTDFKNGCNASLHQIHREIDIDVKEEGGIE